ncbi:MAG: gas vesicle protein [Roseofilum sp. Belize BBD 4]|nr:gas vesicle protein [Roseofilum sp. Belize BBD 4]HBQ99039.1 gas vesicle protein [Cyanobacteria bacterium UBA11691]
MKSANISLSNSWGDRKIKLVFPHCPFPIAHSPFPIPVPANSRPLTSSQSSTLADVLERVLDKGVVIAGDISVSVGSTELLNVRIRLLISSVDKAKEIGINWWESDPYLSSQHKQLQETNERLLERIEQLETQLKALKGTPEVEPEIQE